MTFIYRVFNYGFLILTLEVAGNAGEFLELPDYVAPNRIGVGGRVGFNISASVRDRSGLPTAGMPPAGPEAGGGLNRNYEDGYVRVDSSENSQGTTWNWGYENDGQFSADDEEILLHSSSVVGNLNRSGVEDEPNWGGEIQYTRLVGQLGEAFWGMELAINYQKLSIDDKSNLMVTSRVLTDAYDLGGVVPPEAPYSGNFSGPGPLIGDTPLRRIVAEDAMIVGGHRKMDADMFGMRLGPMMDIPLFERTTMQISGGAAAVFMSSEFAYREILAGTSNAASGSETDWLVGAYVQGLITVKITEALGVFGGIQFQTMDDFSQGEGTKRVEVELEDGLYGTLGVSVSFQ